MGALLLSDAPDMTAEHKERINAEFYPKHRAVAVSRSVILLLALISEVEHHFAFGVAPQIVELWTILIDRVPEANEMYEKRYAGFWPVLRINA